MRQGFTETKGAGSRITLDPICEALLSPHFLPPDMANDKTPDTAPTPNGTSEPLADRANTGDDEMAGGPPPAPTT